MGPMAVLTPTPAPDTIDPLADIDPETFASQTPLVLPGCTWEQYQALDTAFEGRKGVRLRFLHGCIEIMFPTSLNHERRKSHIGCLVEAWCLVRNIEFFINGETTMEKEGEAAGAPDESYMFGEEKEWPDLVIEVALTSGGLSKRAFYKQFSVPEIWIWRRDRLEVHQFDPEHGEYVTADESSSLAGIPMADVEECARLESASQAIREFRKRITERP